MKTLTCAQAETLDSLMARSYISAQIPFLPSEAFPSRDNADNGKRRCCTTMARGGLFHNHQSMPGYLVANVPECHKAWLEWRQKNPDVELWG